MTGKCRAICFVLPLSKLYTAPQVYRPTQNGDFKQTIVRIYAMGAIWFGAFLDSGIVKTQI